MCACAQPDGELKEEQLVVVVVVGEMSCCVAHCSVQTVQVPLPPAGCSLFSVQ